MNYRNFLAACPIIPYICPMKNIAVFASGTGTNAQNLIRYFHIDHPEKEVAISIVVSNRPKALVVERARALHVPTFIIDRHAFYSTPPAILNVLLHHKIDVIVLAGFLWLIPPYLIKTYPHSIINLHPALLPAYGGKGMYGMFVHQAVVANGELESGITIHLVDNQYDHGTPLFQASCRVEPGETPESLSYKIHLLEMEHFPKVVDEWINGRLP